MRKIFLVTAAVAAALFLAACGGGDAHGSARVDAPSGERISEGGSQTAPEGVQSSVAGGQASVGGTDIPSVGGQASGGGTDIPPAGGLELLCDGSSSRNNHFGTDSGYYYFTRSDEIADGLYGICLMYIDYAAKREVYLCSDSGCRHNSESCSAVFSQEEFGTDSLVFVHNGCLYVLSSDFVGNGSMALDFSADGSSLSAAVEDSQAALYRMGLDGSSRQKIFTFPKNTAVENLVVSDGEDLWFVTEKLSFEQEGNSVYTLSEDRTLSKLDVSEKRITDTISLEFSGDSSYKVIGAYGTQLVLKGLEYPNGMSEEDAARLDDEQYKEVFDKSQTVCITLDIRSRAEREIYRVLNDQGLSLSCAVKRGALFVSDYKNNKILKIDILTGEQGTLADAAQKYITDALRDSLCCSDIGRGDDRTLYFVDMNTGEVKHSALTTPQGFGIDILADTQDMVLAIYDCDANPSGGDSYEITRWKYGLISKKDLYGGKGNFVPISMAGRGM